MGVMTSDMSGSECGLDHGHTRQTPLKMMSVYCCCSPSDIDSQPPTSPPTGTCPYYQVDPLSPSVRSALQYDAAKTDSGPEHARRPPQVRRLDTESNSWINNTAVSFVHNARTSFWSRYCYVLSTRCTDCSPCI